MIDSAQPTKPDKTGAPLTRRGRFWPGLAAWRSGFFFLLAVAVVALPRLVNMAAFIEGDEAYYWDFTNSFFLAVMSRDWQATAIGFGHPGITLMWLGALGRLIAWLVGGQPDPATMALPFDFAHLAEYRLPLVLANIALTVGVFVLVKRLFGRWVAWTALILMALEPLYLIDARSMRAEALTNGLIVVTLLSFFLFLDRHNRRYLFLSAVLFGLALLTKLSALFLLAYVGLVLAVYLLVQPIGWMERLRRGVAIYLPWVLIAAVLFFALWPVMWVDPAAGLDLSFGLTFRGTRRFRHMYFLGQILYDDPLIYLYYPLVYLLRVAPPALLGAAMAVIGLLTPIFKPVPRATLPSSDPRGKGLGTVARWVDIRRLRLTRRQVWTLALLGFAVSFGLALSLGGHKYERYLMPSLLGMDIVSAVGLCWLAQWVWTRWLHGRTRYSVETMSWAGLAVLLIVQLGLVLPYHPHYYLYANPLLGGPKTAYNNFEMASMFGLDEAARYLNAQPQAQDKRTAAVNSKEFRPMLHGGWLPLDNLGKWSQADYVLIHIYQLQQQTMNPALLTYLQRRAPLHVVELAGSPYAWIYPGLAVQYFAGPSQLTGKANLLGYDLSAQTLAAGETLSAKFYWENDDMLAGDDWLVQLTDAGETVWAEAVAKPLPGFEAAALTGDQFVESRVDLTVPVGTPPGTYFLRSGVYSRARQEMLGYFTLPADGNAITVTRPSSPPAVDRLAMAHRLNATPAPDVSLLGFDLPGDTLILNEDNQLALWWQAQADVARDYVVSLQLFDAVGEEATYWLGRPVLSGYPTTRWQAGEVVRDLWQLNLPPEMPPGEYALSLTLFDATSQAEVGQVTLGRVAVVERRQQFDLPAMQHEVNVDFQDGVKLLGYDLFAEPITGGGRLHVNLYWQAQAKIGHAYTVFVHLLGPDGTVTAQHDGIPAGGTIPTLDWVEAEIVSDRHLIEFPTLPAGEYGLVVGMYDPATGERLPASGGDTAIQLQTLPVGQ